MSKAARNRRQRTQGHPQDGPRDSGAWQAARLRELSGQDGGVHGDQAIELLQELAWNPVMPCRATFLDDPMFGGRPVPVTGMTDEGQLLTDLSDKPEQIPVLLFEPDRVVLMKDTMTGMTYEWQTEAMVSTGFHRVPPRFVMGFLPADGWGVQRTPGGVVLRDADGAVRAQAELNLDPEWVSAAASCRSVLVLWGTRLGVRVLPGRPPYTDRGRAEEFRRGRREGTLLAASVSWRGLLEEATDWVLFREGSFGLPLPTAYVPSWYFKSSGGPDAFGFTSLARLGAGKMRISRARGLVAELTPTDLDLIRPDADADLGIVTGYHVPPGDPYFADWRAEVLRKRHVLIVTGRQAVPYAPDTLPEQALAVLRESEAATVPLTPSSLRRQSRAPG
jgi:hypothetical protein